MVTFWRLVCLFYQTIINWSPWKLYWHTRANFVMVAIVALYDMKYEVNFLCTSHQSNFSCPKWKFLSTYHMPNKNCIYDFSAHLTGVKMRHSNHVARPKATRGRGAAHAPSPTPRFWQISWHYINQGARLCPPHYYMPPGFTDLLTALCR